MRPRRNSGEFTMTIVRVFIACVLLFPAVSTAQIGNWSLQAVPFSPERYYDMDMANGQFGVVVGESDSAKGYTGVMWTHDGGNNWYTVPDIFFDPPLPPGVVWRAVDVVDENTIFVAGDSALIYRTTNGGMLWEKLRIPPKTKTTIRGIHFTDPFTGVAVGGDSPNTLPQPIPPDPPRMPEPALILVTTDGGQNWSNESPGPATLQGEPALYRVHAAGTTWITTGENSLVMQRTAPGVWTQIPGPSSFYMEDLRGLQLIDPQMWWHSGGVPGNTGPKVYRSTNAGGRFWNVSPPGAKVYSEYRGLYAFNAQYAWAGANLNNLYVTTNAGANWVKFAAVTGLFTSNAPIERMVFSDSLNGWAVGADYIIRYLGTPPRADISATATKLGFATATCERFVDTVLNLRNKGTGELLIRDGDISFNSTEFSVIGVTWPIRVAPGKGRSITIRWRPERTTVGDVTATMSIASNDPDHSPWSVAITARRDYGAMVLDTLIRIQPGVCLKDSVDYQAYPGVVGTRAVTFLSFSFVSGNDEVRLLRPAPGTIITGQEPFHFRTSPRQSGARSGRYRIISGNPSCPDTLYLRFTSEGLFTDIAASVTTVDFGKICVGQLRDTTITVRNIGNTDAFLSRWELASGVDMFPQIENSTLYVQRDSSKQYRLRFAPTLKGSFSATYRIISDPCMDTLLLTFKGEGITTKLDFDPSGGLTVGPVTINKGASRIVTITNTGDTPANVTKVALANAHPFLQLLGTPPLPRVLQPGQFFTVTIQFTPKALGTIETTLDVAWNSVCGDTARLPITAPCVPNPIIQPPTAMDLGEQPCPVPVRDTLWIRNGGNGPLEFTGITMDGLDRAHFTVISPVLGDTVSAKDSIRLILEYNRPTEGISTASLVLNSNDDERTPVYIPLTGRRTVRQFVVRGDSLTEYFTRLFVPQTRSFVVENTGVHPLDITDVQMDRTGVFSASSMTPLPRTLAPGDTMMVEVVFVPNARGPFTAHMRVTSGPCNTTALVREQGRGDTDGISLNTGSVDFDLDPCTFAGACDTIIVSNQGNEPVTLLGVVINQGGTAFSISNAPSLPLVLAPLAEHAFLVCADAAQFGTQSGTLVVTSNDPVYPVIQVPLTSRRDSTSVIVSTEGLDFGRLTQCDPAPVRSVTVTNTGTVAERITAMLAGGTGYTTSFGAGVLLQPGKSYTFDVTLTATALGVHADTLLILVDRCARELRVALSGERVRQTYAAAPPTVTFTPTNIGSGTQQSFTVQNTGSFDGRVRAVEIRPNGGAFTLQGSAPTSIAAGASSSITIRCTPNVEGAISGTVCVIFDQPCADTICVALEGTGIRGAIVVKPLQLNFGTLAQCEDLELRDTVRNTGSGIVMLQTATITGTGATAFTNLTPIAAPESLAPGGERVFRIRYTAAQAAGDGAVNAVLAVTTDLPSQPTVDIPLAAGRSTLRAATGAVFTLGNIEINQPQQRIVRLTNTGSTRLCYDASSQPAQITFTPTLPFCLEPGASQDVTVRVTPDAEGFWSPRLVLRATQPCEDSTIIRFDATVQAGGLTQTPARIDLGQLATCEVSTFDVRITNTYLEAASLDSLRIDGPDRTYFSILSPSSTPQPISPGSSLTVSMQFTGQNLDRVYAARLTSYVTVFGQQTTLGADLVAETRRPTFTVTGIAFPTLTIGQPAEVRTVTVRNTSTLPIEISAAGTAVSGFTVSGSTPPMPAMLQPGDSVVLEVTFGPTAPGPYADSIVVIARRPCFVRVSAPLTGELLARTIVQAHVIAGTLFGEVDDVIRIPLTVDQDVTTSDVTGWSGAVTFNQSMLHPLRVVTEGSLSATMNVGMTVDRSASSVRITAANGAFTGSSSTLAWLECLVLVGDDITTPITLSNDFSFADGFATVAARRDGRFTLMNYCLPSTRLVTRLQGFTLTQNSPNPVSLHLTGTTRIAYSIAHDGFTELVLSDALGRRVRTLVATHQTAGAYDITVSLQDLAPGVYHYTLQNGVDVASRMLVLTR